MENIAEKRNCDHEAVEAKQSSISLALALDCIRVNIWNYLGNTVNIPPASLPYKNEQDKMAERNRNIINDLNEEDRNVFNLQNEKGHTLYDQTIGEILKEADQQGYKNHPFVVANRDLFEEEQ